MWPAFTCYLEKQTQMPDTTPCGVLTLFPPRSRFSFFLHFSKISVTFILHIKIFKTSLPFHLSVELPAHGSVFTF